MNRSQVNANLINLCFLLILPSASFHQVAVIIGGANSTHELAEVEVYIGNDDNIIPISNCPDTNRPPEVPNFPYPMKGASGVYIPDIGIYVCGGVRNGSEMERTCYKYNPSENSR